MAYSPGSTLNGARRLRDPRATGETHRQSALMFDLDTLCALAASGLEEDCPRRGRLSQDLFLSRLKLAEFFPREYRYSVDIQPHFRTPGYGQDGSRLPPQSLSRSRLPLMGRR